MDKHKHKSSQERRECFVATIFDTICKIGKDKDLRLHLKANLIGLGLFCSDVGIEFYASEDWSDRSRRQEHLEKIKNFLIEVI